MLGWFATGIVAQLVAVYLHLDFLSAALAGISIALARLSKGDSESKSIVTVSGLGMLLTELVVIIAIIVIRLHRPEYRDAAIGKERHRLLRYTDAVHDAAIGLYLFGSRFYDASIGRFVQPDSFGGVLTDPLSLNRYAYAGDNPMTFVDLTGRSWLGNALNWLGDNWENTVTIGLIVGALACAAFEPCGALLGFALEVFGIADAGSAIAQAGEDESDSLTSNSGIGIEAEPAASNQFADNLGETAERTGPDYEGTYTLDQRAVDHMIGEGHVAEITAKFGIREPEVWPLIKQAIQYGTFDNEETDTVALNYLYQGSTLRVVLSTMSYTVWTAYPVSG